MRIFSPGLPAFWPTILNIGPKDGPLHLRERERKREIRERGGGGKEGGGGGQTDRQAGITFLFFKDSLLIRYP